MGKIKRSQKFALVMSSLCLLTGIVGVSEANAATPEEFNRKMSLGVNLGNCLEAPNEGEWGLKIEPEYMKLIAAAGFKHVRIPIRWSSHAMKDAPYTVEPKFFARVDEVLKEALENKLLVVLNMHHYEEFEAAPDAHQARFKAIWHQIAEHYSKVSDDVAFEIYNEPCKQISDEGWNKLYPEVLQDIRRTNANRQVIVGPVNWNNLHKLESLRLPDNDRHIIVTVHYYEPFKFTHQGAEWIGAESTKWLGNTWKGADAEKANVDADFDIASAWGRAHNRPIYVGEFGAYSKADMDSRSRWTHYVRDAALKRGFSAAYWEFGSGFGVYDPQAKTWRAPLLNALTGR